MDNQNLIITRATATDVQNVSALIAEAFTQLDVCRYLVPDTAAPQELCRNLGPDDAERERVLGDYFRIYVEHAVAHGHIDLLGDGQAAAVWLPHRGVKGSTVPAIVDHQQRLTAAVGGHLDRFEILEAYFDTRHTAIEAIPHDHLALLAVHPDAQRRGLGSALLAHHHAELDREHLGAYLEAASEECRELYLRHDYADLGDPIVLPGGQRVFPMLRPANFR
ncbi:GNAT family N-acetyltransferase [Longispora urticae]